MVEVSASRIAAQLRRELQEYRNSLLLTPVVIAAVLAMVMLCSVLMANRISVMGDAMLDVIMQEESMAGMNISIRIEGDADEPDRYEYEVERWEEPVVEEDWDFSRQWEFDPQPPGQPQPQPGATDHTYSLNPMLNMIHNFMLLVLVLVSAHYLLSSLFADRRDRSILFWKSLPVSEWEEVLTKFAVALVLAPAIYIALSLLAQVLCTLLAMLLVWRLDKDPWELVLGNVHFPSLLLTQVGGWLRAALLVAPLYAWLMLSSAAARRSPFLFALAPVVALVLLERVFLGSGYLASMLSAHIPHYVVGADQAIGAGSGWGSPNWLTVIAGLCLAGLALWGAVWLRRYRFEL